jgi:hypothetical protein
MRKTDGQTVKIDFNPSSSKSAYQDLPEEERQKNKDLSFILEKIMLATALSNLRKLFSTIRGSSFFIY